MGYVLAMTSMQIPGYRVLGAVGHGLGGSAYSVAGPAGGQGVAVIVERSLEERIRTLSVLRHPALPEILDLVPLPGHQLAVVLATVVGPSLATLVQARGRLLAGELVTLWRGIADALGAMHRHGLVHGDVSPGNIVISPSGPVLLDILGHGGVELGHRGHVAPEVLAGLPGSAASDVWALARAVAWAGGDDPAVVTALGASLAEDPGMRPGARPFATWAFVLGQPVEIAVPDAGALAGAQVRAGVAATILRGEREEPRGGARLRGQPRGGLRLAGHAGSGRAGSRLAGVALGALVLAGVVLLVVGQLGGGSEGSAGGWLPVVEEPTGAESGAGAAAESGAGAAAGPGAGTESDEDAPPELNAGTARAVVEQLLAARDRGIETLDQDALRAVYVPGSAPYEADVALIEALAGANVTFQGFGTDLGQVFLEEAQTSTARASAWISGREHGRVEEGASRRIARTGETCISIGLELVDSTWRIATLEPCD